MQAMPIILSESNCTLIGPNGCGKTLSYLIPLITRLLMQETALPFNIDDDPYAVICVADNATQQNMVSFIDKFFEALTPQLKTPTHIMVTTPS
jgi:superfamily II DNA/RNA helicase